MKKLLKALGYKRTTDGRYFKSNDKLIIQFLHNKWSFYKRGEVIFTGNDKKAKEFLSKY